MNLKQQQHFDKLYQHHLDQLVLQGKRCATIDAYSRAVRRVRDYFDLPPDELTTEQLRQYFRALIDTHSWSTVKLDRNGLQFFYRYTLDKQWTWLNIVKPPQVKRLPDILTPHEIGMIISHTQQLRYQVCMLTLYTLGLRLGEALSLTVSDIDAQCHQVHIRNAKGGKDRLVPLPKRTLVALRTYWSHHRDPKWLFPGSQPDRMMDRGGVQKAMKRVCQSCSINKRVSPHSLRHAYATHLLTQGVDLRTLQQLLGHGSLNTTARYTQLTEARRQSSQVAMNQLADALSIRWAVL